jgi:hypothetical protein
MATKNAEVRSASWGEDCGVRCKQTSLREPAGLSADYPRQRKITALTTCWAAMYPLPSKYWPMWFDEGNWIKLYAHELIWRPVYIRTHELALWANQSAYGVLWRSMRLPSAAVEVFGHLL